MKKVLVPVAEGSEELETIAVVDILRRAGIRVEIVSVKGLEVLCSKGVKLVAEKEIENVLDEEYDLIVIPGGMPGAQNLRNSEELSKILLRHFKAGRPIGAICAAPAIVLAPLGIISGRRVTCHPSFSHLLGDGIYDPSSVVEDENIITAKGAGYAISFALKILERLSDPETVKEVMKGMTLL